MLQNTSFRILTVLLAVLVFTGCSKDAGAPNVEVIQDMMEQPAIKAQDFQPQDREKSGMRVPPVGTWPKNVKPFLYKGSQNAVLAGEKLRNPFAGQNSEEINALGKIHYNNFCMVCHGEGGGGDGPVAAKFIGIKPPSLVTDKIKNYPDGRIFHIITDGQGVMGTYIHQLPGEKDRWAVVNYVRQLQSK